MAAPTQDASVVAQAIIDILANPANGLNLAGVFYGDQELIPKVPAATVETGPTQRELGGASSPPQTMIMFNILIMLYEGGLRDNQVTKKAVDVRAEATRAVLHANFRLGGLVIYSLVSSIEPGTAIRKGELIRAARLTWQGTTKLLLG